MLYHDVGYLKNPILKICDFSANMYHMNMIFRFLESLLLGLSLECFLIIFGHFFEILCHFEFDVYFWAADSLPISQKWKYGENHPKYHLMNIFPFQLNKFSSCFRKCLIYRETIIWVCKIIFGHSSTLRTQKHTHTTSQSKVMEKNKILQQTKKKIHQVVLWMIFTILPFL